MKKIIGFLILFFLLASCNKEEIRKLEQEKMQLESVNIKLESDLKTLNDSIMGITKEKNNCDNELVTIKKERDDYKAKSEALINQQLNQEKEKKEKGM